MLGWMKRRRIKRRNRKRRARRYEEEFGARADFARGFPCVVRGCDDWPTQAAHVKSRGAGGKAASNIVSLCAEHHQQQHQIGILTFEARHELDLRDEASRIETLFRKYGSVGGRYDLPF